jgi:hypothetical protein
MTSTYVFFVLWLATAILLAWALLYAWGYLEKRAHLGRGPER